MKAAAKFMICFFIFSSVLIGCSSSQDDKYKKADVLARIQLQQESGYTDMFRTLGLGTVYNFELNLPYADKTWVYIWVEGFRKGKAIDSLQSISLSYGFSPSETSKGPMGWGIVNEGDGAKHMIIYAPGVSTGLIPVPDVIEKDLSSLMDYASIGDQGVQLASGESRVLAVYRQNESGGYENLDPNDSEQLKKMLDIDAVTLLLKIKVDDKAPS